MTTRALYRPPGGAVTASVTTTPATQRPRGRAGRSRIPGPVMAAAFLVAAALLLTACGRKESKPAEPTPGSANATAPAPISPAANPVNPEAPLDVQEKQRVAQAVAMRDGKAPPPPAIQLRGGEMATPEVLAAYNQQLAQLIFQQKDAPETLEELVRKWRMPRLPTPPAGKQIVYDARNRIIKLYPP